MSTLNVKEGQLAELIERYNYNLEHINKNTIPTGFRAIDKIIKGFSLGELVVVGARPGVGKTTFLLGLAKNMSIINNIPSLFISLEMCVTKLTGRMMQVLDGSDYNNKTPLYFVNTDYDLEDIITKIEKYIALKGIKIIFLDTIQLVSTNNDKYRDLNITTTINKLKDIAISNNVLIILSSQLNRKLEYRNWSKIPVLSDLRDSGSLEQNANKVLFIYRPEYYGIIERINDKEIKDIAEIIISKNSVGKTGVAALEFNKEKSIFKNVDISNLDFGDINTDIVF